MVKSRGLAATVRKLEATALSFKALSLMAARGGARRRRSRAKRNAGARVSAMGSATETREMERNNDGHVCVCVRGRTDVCW